MAERELVAEEPLELRRNLDALRRGRTLILLFVLLVTGATVGISMALPARYQAHATIVLQDNIQTLGSSDVNAVKRGLLTFERLLGTNYVLAAAAAKLPDETRSSLRSKVSSSVDPDANIITISALDDTAKGAAAIANAVARTFLAQQADLARRRVAAARANLNAQLAQLRTSGATPEELAAVESRIGELAVNQANAETQLQIAQPAEPPSSRYSPRPVRNGLVAFFASLFVAILAALGRDRLAPRVASARELSRSLNAPILAALPFVRRQLGRRVELSALVAKEAYQALQSSLRLELPPTRQRVVLVVSATEGEGQSAVVAGLGRALARAGQKTLVVSADIRFPTLHELLGAARTPGFSDVLFNGASSPLELPIVSVGPNLDLIPSGTAPSDPAALLSGDALDEFFSLLGLLDYAYVLVEGAPLLGVADSNGLARRAESLVLVSRPEQLTHDDMVETRDLLNRLQITPLGLVVVGARRPRAYAYAAARLLKDLSAGRVSA